MDLTACRRIIIAFVICAANLPAQARDAAGNPVHWAYSAFFGTGRYKIDGQASVYTARISPRWDLRAAELDDDGQRKLGIELRLPITLGVHDFDRQNLLRNFDADNVNAVSAVPGVEIEIPINVRWTLKPLVHAGYGAQLSSSESAPIYWAGVKSKIDFRAGETDWSLLNSLTYVGFTSNTAPRSEFLALMTGFEFQRQLKEKKIGGRPVVLHWHVAHRRNLNELDFDLTGSIERVDIPSEWELGIAFGRAGSRLSFWRLGWDRVGVASRFSSNGDLSGFSLTFKSLFDR
jgi:hypothetical protein